MFMDDMFDELIRETVRGMSREDRGDLFEKLKADIPADVLTDLEELAKIECRIFRRIKRNQALVMADVLRWNEICFKHYEAAQDVPASVCGLPDMEKKHESTE